MKTFYILFKYFDSRSFLWSKTSGQTSPGRSATMTMTKPQSHFLNEKKKDAALSERLALWADSLKDNLNQKIIDTAKGMAKYVHSFL